MFAVTERLLLRPGWIEDAPALADAIAHEEIVRNLARAPWPYSQEDAEGYLALDQDIFAPRFQLIDRVGQPGRMIGGIGLDRMDDGEIELGYWLTPDYWGRGLMTEAGRAVIDAATSSLGYRRFTAGHFVDNPASGRVLRKLGFRQTGRIEPRRSAGRGCEVDCILYDLEVEEDSRVPSLGLERALAA